MAQGRIADPAAALTDADKALLTLAQLRVPLTSRPFEALGQSLGLTEAEVIARLRALKEAGFIRKIGPVMEPGALGLASELVAARVLPAHLDQVGAAVAAWPEVTHCYAREHEVNLWFAGVAAASEWFESATAQVAAMEGVQGVWRLPTIRRFKIAVHFELAPVKEANSRGVEEPKRQESDGRLDSSPIDFSTSRPLDSSDLLNAIQSDLPLSPEPFRELAEHAGVDFGDMMATLTDLLRTGVVRRYGALVNHRRLGFTANAMVVMAVPPERIEAAGARLAESPHVSHCYQRPPFPGFPYNLYAMVHGRDREECLEVVANLIGAHRCAPSGDDALDWQALFSTREYGKSAPNYARLLVGASGCAPLRRRAELEDE